MPVTVTVQGENALQAAQELRNFVVALQFNNPNPTDAQVKANDVAPKKKAKPAPVEDDAEDAPAPKKKAKPAPADDDDDDVPAPKKKAKPAPADDDDDDAEDAPAPKKKAKAEEPATELVDDGEDQEATVDGCRIMIRRVARAKGCGTEHAQAVLAEFGVAGATKVPEKKMQKFIDRCQAVIDDPESIELAE